VIARVDVSGLPPRRAAGLRADARVAKLLATLPPRITAARVVFRDENATKGGVDMRGAITVSLAGRGRIHVAEVATTPRQALDGALDKLTRRLARTQQRKRESSRRPKKYHVAARLAGGGV
jgi:ribosome-associated translation inhibitor RaiA